MTQRDRDARYHGRHSTRSAAASRATGPGACATRTSARARRRRRRRTEKTHPESSPRRRAPRGGVVREEGVAEEGPETVEGEVGRDARGAPRPSPGLDRARRRAAATAGAASAGAARRHREGVRRARPSARVARRGGVALRGERDERDAAHERRRARGRRRWTTPRGAQAEASRSRARDGKAELAAAHAASAAMSRRRARPRRTRRTPRAMPWRRRPRPRPRTGRRRARVGGRASGAAGRGDAGGPPRPAPRCDAWTRARSRRCAEGGARGRTPRSPETAPSRGTRADPTPRGGTLPRSGRRSSSSFSDSPSTVRALFIFREPPLI